MNTAPQPEPKTPPAAAPEEQLERGTYEIIRSRLKTHAQDLELRLKQLNQERRSVFGSIPTKLLSSQRITTENNCIAQDIVPVGDRFIFGYNVHMGLKSVTELKDVFSVYHFGSDGLFHEEPITFLADGNFEHDFFQLYKYYKDTRFLKFHVLEPHVYLVFQVGRTASDFKAFKFLVPGGQWKYLGNRFDHEVVFPPQHDFKWIRTHRDLHRHGKYPHISIENRVFVETVGGDLTIKVEDNTDDGSGIYTEPVDDRDQTLDDAEIFYSIVGNLILLKIRPFKENSFRYLIFNEKNQSVQRMDSIANACISLPEGHGLIFSAGYYLQTGVVKTFENQLTDLMFERRIAAPDGENYLYVFHNRNTGQNVLMSYNMIEQSIENPLLCNGFSIFENGQMIFFRTDPSPQKHHAVQIWQTPYVGEAVAVSEKQDSFIFKLGNKEVVRAMAECHEILNLIAQEDSFTNLYLDLVKKSNDVLDSYFWLKDQAAFELAQPLRAIHATATAAVDEFDKVVRIRKNTQKQFDETATSASSILSQAVSRQFRHIDDFVDSLANLRNVRGQIISLKELKYIDLAAVDELEKRIVENTDLLSRRCVDFLLKPDSLETYATRVAEQEKQIETLTTGVQAKTLGEEIGKAARELEMLIEIVSNLKIDDPNQRTRIIDNISTIYSNLNQTRAKLKRKAQSLLAVEGEAEFSSQMKLIGQAVVNYLDVCDSPDRCDEYLTKTMVQIEEIEGKFADFDHFIVQLAEKREEIYTAFDTRKLQLIEARNRRATALMQAADRILNSIRSRVASFKSVDQINSYFASDLMIEKLRELVGQLQELSESVKIDEIQSRLKTIREDAVRQLRDKQELFVDGQSVIQFGKYKFSVNTQPLELTMVLQDGEMYFHLSGTNFFEKVNDDQLLATRAVWDQIIVSENRNVYRSEYLAYLILKQHAAAKRNQDASLGLGELSSEESLIEIIQQFMSARYAEGYIKGVHDHDAARILQRLLSLHTNLQLLAYPSSARALALLYWCDLKTRNPEERRLWKTKLASLGVAASLFGEIADRQKYLVRIQEGIKQMVDPERLGGMANEALAAAYLFDQLSGGKKLAASRSALNLLQAFEEHLKSHQASQRFNDLIGHDSLSTVHRYLIIRDWIAAFLQNGSAKQREDGIPYLDEVAVMITDEKITERDAIDVESVIEIDGMLGDHPRVQAKSYQLGYHEFMERLATFQAETVPAFETYVHLKKEILDRRREELRLDEFRSRVLTSFVRNRLINDTYLPMIGTNLAKQIGVVGENKRTDLMGMLLLISPPGYGKTTLMEYIANRLGITFMTISGPALGHQVKSLDPQEAPNASARREVEKLNLALEMGDNVMIYVDDIQHCHPEFLQKFIPLCDATRKIEGIFRGRPRTYDLRGRKVAVVMAGNPYTESGEKFRIPDMLASRADTYNLGDVIGGNQESFELSYLENCLTSNPTLAPLSLRRQKDVHTIIQMAQRPNTTAELLEGNYSIEEVNEFVSVMRKLIKARSVILKVNRQYIESAAQADAYRTEPAFKLQGSYRDMNKIAEKIAPIMNDEELDLLIRSHYQNQAQTLTTGAEANLLKLDELMGTLTGDRQERWNEIKRTFQRNLLLGAANDGSQLSQVLAQMTTFSEGLHHIRAAVSQGVKELVTSKDHGTETLQAATLREISHAVAELAKFNTTLEAVAQSLNRPAASPTSSTEKKTQQTIEVVNKIPNLFADIIRNQFSVLQTWMEPILELAKDNPKAQGLKKAAELTEKNYLRIIKQIGEQDSTASSEEN
jgi:hypothetical protein